jgi:hypothetical protein
MAKRKKGQKEKTMQWLKEKRNVRQRFFIFIKNFERFLDLTFFSKLLLFISWEQLNKGPFKSCV